MDLIFLIKSIMNKKLFSWKALAGLALLVAMGLTSCKQDTVVDPNDPYNTSKPTTPSISTKGTADVTITITKAGDLATQWASLDAATVKKLREKTTLNVAINNAGYELEGAVIALPNFFSGADNGAVGKIVNVTFTSGFQNAGYNLSQAEYPLTGTGDLNAAKKQFLWLNTDNLAGNQVNFYFPAGNFDLNLVTTKVQASLNSEAGANIGILNAQAGASKSALSINSGVAVKGINLTAGDVKVNGGTIAAKLATTTETFASVNWSYANGGFPVGTTELIYVKSLIVDRNVTTTANGIADNQGTAESIIIKKNGSLVLSDNKPHVTSIVGEHANAKVNINGSTDWTGYIQDLSTIGSLEKVVISATADNWLNLSDVSKFNTVEFKNRVLLTTHSVSNITFNKLSIPVNADNITFDFSNVKFITSSETITNADGSTTTINYPELYADYETQTSSTTKTWQWIVDGTGSGYWSEVKSTAPLKAYNADANVQEFHYTAVNPTEGSAALGGWNTGAVTSTVIKITYTTEDYIWPEGTVISLNGCKSGSDAIQVKQANDLFGNVSEKTAWYDVVLNGTTLKWRLNSSDKWVLVNP